MIEETCPSCHGPGPMHQHNGMKWRWRHTPDCKDWPEYHHRLIQPEKADLVNHPPHYKTGGIETIDFIEAKQLPYHLGNVIKYVTRAPHKGSELQDLEKAQWYLTRHIERLKAGAK